MRLMMLLGFVAMTSTAFAAPMSKANLQIAAQKGLAKAWNVSGVDYKFDHFKLKGAGLNKSFSATLKFSNGQVLGGKINTKTGEIKNVEILKPSL